MEDSARRRPTRISEFSKTQIALVPDRSRAGIASALRSQHAPRVERGSCDWCSQCQPALLNELSCAFQQRHNVVVLSLVIAMICEVARMRARLDGARRLRSQHAPHVERGSCDWCCQCLPALLNELFVRFSAAAHRCRSDFGDSDDLRSRETARSSRRSETAT